MGKIRFKKFEDFKSTPESEENDNLYHSTDLEALNSILFLNKLAGVTPQEIKPDVMVRGISCTSDKNYVYKNYDITLELDSSLKRKYKCININFFETEFGKSKQKEHNLKVEDEKEVFIITGSIDDESYLSPLAKYLVSIKLNKKGVVLTPDMKDIIESNYKKIKIYNYLNKDITNTIIKNKNKIASDLNDINMGYDDYSSY